MKTPQMALAGAALYMMMKGGPKYSALGSGNAILQLQQMTVSDFYAEVQGQKASSGLYMGQDLQSWFDDNITTDSPKDMNQDKWSEACLRQIKSATRRAGTIYQEVQTKASSDEGFRSRFEALYPQFEAWEKQLGKRVALESERAFANAAASFYNTQLTVKDYYDKVVIPVFQQQFGETSYGVSKYKTALQALYDAANVPPLQFPAL